MQPADAERRDLDAHHRLVGELAERVTHDLANRLAVARLTAEVLANRGDLPGDLAGRVATVVQATGEAGELVQRLSAIAGRRPAPPHRVDLAAVVTDLTGLLRAALGRRQLEVRTQAAPLVADRRDIEEIVLRLVLAGPPGAAGEGIAVAVHPDGDDVVMVVRQPSELSPSSLARLTQLAPVTSVALPGGGQEHTVRLAGAPEGVPGTVPVPTGDGGRVLVVEDDTDLRELVVEALAADGHTVDGVADATSALEHRWVAAGELELLVTDVELPGMSGLELAERLSATGVALVVMSGHGEDALGVLPAGALVLDKPFGVPDLRSRARQALR